MRMLVVTNMYPPHHYGGYELSCQDTVRRFRARGHEVSVLTSTIQVEGVESPRNEDGGRVGRELELYWHDHVLLSPSLWTRLKIERHNQQALERALTAARPDLVSIWNMGALSLGLLTTISRRRLPMVFVIGDDWPCYAQRLDAWSRLFHGPVGTAAGRLIESITGVPASVPDVGAMGACCFNSEAMRRAARQCLGVSLPRTGIVYSGIEATDFPVAADDAPVSNRPWRGELLYVGRLDERKGIDTVLRALVELPAARLTVVGRGDNAYLVRLRELAARLRVADRVVFTATDRSQLRSVYRAADALVFPSVYDEPFGLVPLEAMACDTPVVATGRGGSGEYLTDGGNCLLFPAGDHVQLVGAISRLADHPDLRAKVVIGGRGAARALTTDALAETLLAWHDAALAGFAHGQPADRELRRPRL